MSAIVVIAALVALVWGTLFLLRGSLMAGGLAYVIAAAVFGYDCLHFDVGSVPLTIDRIVLLVLLLAYAIQRRLGRTEPKPIGRTEVAMLLFVLYAFASGTLMQWEGTPRGSWVNLWRFVNSILAPCILYWIVRQSTLQQKHMTLLYATITTLGLYLALTGLMEVSGQWWAVFPPHIADAKLGLHFGRARGPMLHAVSYGLYVGIAFFAAYLFQWRFQLRGRMVLWAACAAILVGVVCSLTRSVWIGTALGGAILLGMTLPGRWRTLVLGTMVAGALLVAVTRFDAVMGFQRDDTAADARKSVEMRGAFTYVSWQMFQDRPLFGFGWGQFFSAKLPYLADRTTPVVLEAIREYIHHNTFLSILTELGGVGLGLYLIMLIGWGRAGWRLFRNPASSDWERAQGMLLLAVLATYCVQGLFHDLTYSPVEHALVFLVAGVTMGLDARQRAAVPGGTAGLPSSVAPFNPGEHGLTSSPCHRSA